MMFCQIKYRRNTMNTITNKLLLNRKQSVALVANQGTAYNSHMVLALMADIAQLGYTLDKPVMDIVSTFDKYQIKAFHSFLVEELKVMVGANVRYVPLFKSFPNGIPDTDELMFKKILGYFQNLFGINPKEYKVLACGHLVCTHMFNLDNYSACPICEKQDLSLMDHDDSHKDLEGVKQFKIIKLVEESVVFDVFKNLLMAKTSISDSDKEAIQTLIAHFGDAIKEHLPTTVDQKETMVYLVHQLMNHTSISEKDVAAYFKTATDVLRLAVQLSGGDVSLAANTKFKLKNRERKLVLSLLNNVNNAEVDMVRYRENWIKLGEVLHVGRYAKKYPVAFAAFDKIRNHVKEIETFNSKVESLLMAARYESKNKVQMLEAVQLLSTRAGEFARRLDYMLRIASVPTDVVKGFEGVVGSVQTAMLLNIRKHIKNRDNKREFRAYIPKGKMSKIQLIDGDDRDVISITHINKVVKIIDKELKSRFSKQESLGKVLIKKELESVLVPFSQRSASKSLINLPRGSRIKLDNSTPFVRLFTYWKAPVDVDLAIAMFDEKLVNKGVISYYNLSSYGRSVHSGDIRDGRHGAVEFVDIDVEAFKRTGIRYVAVNIYSYTGEPFSTMECFAGYMERQEPNGRQFDATTVRQKFDITSESRSCTPMLFDLENMEVIWLDLVTKSDGIYGNYHNSQNVTMDAMKAGLDMVNIKTTLFELFDFHAKARAELVHYEPVEGVEYDTVFDLDKLMDLDEIMSKYLA